MSFKNSVSNLLKDETFVKKEMSRRKVLISKVLVAFVRKFFKLFKHALRDSLLEALLLGDA